MMSQVENLLIVLTTHLPSCKKLRLTHLRFFNWWLKDLTNNGRLRKLTETPLMLLDSFSLFVKRQIEKILEHLKVSMS
jgi:hypothetical protein